MLIFTDVTQKIEVAGGVPTNIITAAASAGWLQWLLVPCQKGSLVAGSVDKQVS